MAIKPDIKKPDLEYTGTPNKLDLSQVKYIIVHHWESGKQHTGKDVHRWHLDDGWAGNGYNYGILWDGTKEEYRGLEFTGAHAGDYNPVSIGIGLAGNFEEHDPSSDQYTSLAELIAWLLTELPNDVEIIGHYDAGNTSCPGRYFSFNTLGQELDKLEEGKDMPEIIGKQKGVLFGEEVEALLVREDNGEQRTYLQLRQLEQYGFKVGWDSKEGFNINISKKEG